MDNAILEARHDSGAYRRIEVITGKSRRRRTDAEKARMVAESFEEGSISPKWPGAMGSTVGF